MTLQTEGYAITQAWGGAPRQPYYTPDGREENKIIQYRQRADGVVYDLWLAMGYSLTPPEHPKLYCSGCDRWHDTLEEVEACIQKKNAIDEDGEKIVLDDDRLGQLEKRFGKMEENIGKLLQSALAGQKLQSEKTKD